ncbi:MAG: hypothetical protein QM606_08920 [Leucobacter sp.]
MSNDTNGRMPHSRRVEDILIQRMHEDLARPKRRKAVWGGIAAAGITVAFAAGCLVAVSLSSPKEITDQLVVHCLNKAVRNSDGTLPGITVSVTSLDGILPIDKAEAVCGKMRELGAIDEPDPSVPEPNSALVQAEFTTCVTKDGEAAVVPGRVKCSALGLQPHHPRSPEGW